MIQPSMSDKSKAAVPAILSRITVRYPVSFAVFRIKKHWKNLRRWSRFLRKKQKNAAAVSNLSGICYQAYKTDENESVVKEFQKACTACGIKSSLIATFGGSDQNKMSEHGIPGIVMASAMHQVHSCQEYTEVSEMAQVAGIVSELLQMKE